VAEEADYLAEEAQVGTGETFDRIFSEAELKILVERIREIELKTTAEIRIHIASQISSNGILHDANLFFQQLGMENTKDRNGVLIVVAPAQRKIACWGDIGIDRYIQREGWDSLIQKTLDFFREKKFLEGMLSILAEIENKMTIYFPIKSDSPKNNELSDEISKS
jgi:uncharacterized membrane protein